MASWAIRRVLAAVLLAVAGTLVLVLLVHLLPGDPVATMLGERALDPAVEAAFRARWGLDRPLLEQLGAFLSGAVRGDLGLSLLQERPVTTILAERLGPTLLLGGMTLLVDFTIGLAIGLWTALRPRTFAARAVGALTLVTYTIPSFVIGLVLVWVFAIELRWFPAGGASDALLPLDAGAWAILLDRLHHLALPLATLVLATIAVPIRQQAAAASGARDAEWVTAARARGVAPWRIACRHVWRPALTPIVTLLGLWLPLLVSGAVFVEAVFAWPGIGALIAEATANRDVPLVIGCGIVLVIAVQLGSLVADLLYRIVDPVQRAS